MKSIRTIPRAGFTLIELLVVISIIALLASIAVPTANIVMRKAKEAEAKSVMAGLITAIKSYQTEYNRFPDPANGTTQDTAITIDGNDGLMAILHPDTTQSPPALNPRRIPFYEPKPAKNGSDGYDTNTKALLDPWSSTSNPHCYRVAMDYNGDGAIDSSVDPTGGSTNIPTTVIAWCTGQPIAPPSENTGTDPKASKYFLASWK